MKEDRTAKRDEEFERVAKVHRTTTDEARAEGIGAAPSGSEAAAPAYADETGVTDLGVDEPALPAASDEARAHPTGQFAGETEADRRKEDAVRRVLEARFPATTGTWKEGGRVPSADDERGESPGD